MSESQTALPLLSLGSDCEVHDLVLDGNNLGVDGIKIFGKSNVLVKNCDVLNLDRDDGKIHGIYIRTIGGDCNNIRIEDCDIDSVIYSGVVPAASRGIYINDLHPVYSMSDIFIERCTFSNIYSNDSVHDGDCIQIQSPGSLADGGNESIPVSITYCDFSNFSARAIKVTADDVIITDNYIHDANFDRGGDGISLYGSHSVVEYNEIDFSTEIGFPNSSTISVGGNNNVLTDNTLLMSTSTQAPLPTGRASGFYLFNSASDNLIQDNEIRNGKFGLSVWDVAPVDFGTDNIFTNNVIDVGVQSYFHAWDPTASSTNNTTAPNTIE